MCGKSSPGSGSKKCKDAGREASMGGIMVEQGIRAGWQMMFNSLISKLGSGKECGTRMQSSRSGMLSKLS